LQSCNKVNKIEGDTTGLTCLKLGEFAVRTRR